jgi:hypothetical protein
MRYNNNKTLGVPQQTNGTNKANFAMVILGCCSSAMIGINGAADIIIILSIHDLTPTLALSCNV